MNKALLSIVFITGSLIFAAKGIPFPSLNNPTSILTYDDKIYISEKFSISIYSLRDHSLIKKFGREGEGPQEFKFRTRLDFFEKQLIVVSMGKISYYDKFGNYLKERRCPQTFLMTGKLLPKENFVSIDSFSAPKRTVSIYDSNFKKVKDICMNCPGYQSGAIIGNNTILQTHGNKIFLVRSKDFAVDVFDKRGTMLHSITQDYNRIIFSKKHKDDLFNSLKSIPGVRDSFPQMKKNFKFSGYLPAIKKILLSGNKIYIQTFKQKQDMHEFYIFDINGKLLKVLFLPLQGIFGEFPFSYPFTIQNERIYQFVENETSDIWELFITKIKL